MRNVSLVPGSPLSVTVAAKVHGAPFSVQVPLMVATLPAITSDVSDTLRIATRVA
jgi:hypothetical protein